MRLKIESLEIKDLSKELCNKIIGQTDKIILKGYNELYWSIVVEDLETFLSLHELEHFSGYGNAVVMTILGRDDSENNLEISIHVPNSSEIRIVAPLDFDNYITSIKVELTMNKIYTEFSTPNN